MSVFYQSQVILYCTPCSAVVCCVIGDRDQWGGGGGGGGGINRQ